MSAFGGVSDILRIKSANFNLAQAAATYDILTATGGNIWVEIEAAQVMTAAGGLVSASIQTNHAVAPKTVVASALLAAITGDLNLTLVSTKFVLPSGLKIQGTIVGTGNAGSITLVVKYYPLAAGATLV